MRLAVGARTVAIEVLGDRDTDALEEPTWIHRRTAAGPHDAHRDPALGRQAQVAEVARFTDGKRCDRETSFRLAVCGLDGEHVVARRDVDHLEAAVAHVAMRFESTAAGQQRDG